VEKPDRQRSLAKPKHRWMDNIKMDLPETGRDGIKLKKLN
jgi:hypothetical protein